MDIYTIFLMRKNKILGFSSFCFKVPTSVISFRGFGKIPGGQNNTEKFL